MKKYEIIKDMHIMHNGAKLFRIRALKNFGRNITKGEIGGLIESENNLSQGGDCWLSIESKCYENGRILNNAFARLNCEIFGNAQIRDNVYIDDGVKLSGNVVVFENAQIGGDAVYDKNQMIGGYHIINGIGHKFCLPFQDKKISVILTDRKISVESTEKRYGEFLQTIKHVTDMLTIWKNKNAITQCVFKVSPLFDPKEISRYLEHDFFSWCQKTKKKETDVATHKD